MKVQGQKNLYKNYEKGFYKKGLFPEDREKKPLIVLKFGSSVIKEEEDLKNIVHEIYGYLRQGYKVIAVVSAIGKDTDSLFSQANRIYNDQNAMIPMLVRLGEFRSAALLSMALLKIGIQATTVDPVALGLRANGKNMNANLVSVNHEVLHQLLEHNDSLIIPGYVAINKKGEYVTLGRGGTDLTAIFLGIEMKAQKIRLIKDVDGVYHKVPEKNLEEEMIPLKEVGWNEVVKINKGIVQKKALKKAEDSYFPVSVGGLVRNYETTIGLENIDIHFKDKYEKFRNLKQKKIRLALLGCGVVGYGVYQHCLRHSEFFKVNHILVRDLEKHKNISKEVVTNNINNFHWKKIDILVEVMGGTSLAHDCIKKALKQRIPVVTANKQLISQSYHSLKNLSQENSVPLLYSAAVGGGTPILEAIDLWVKQGRKIKTIESVVNGTTNFVLDQYFKGTSFEAAVKKAQKLGFAEADPSMDVNGEDAAAKLSIMVQHAFGYSLPIERIDREELSEVKKYDLKEIKQEKKKIRHIARCHMEGSIIFGEVKLETLPQKHFLAGACDEENRVIVTFEDNTEETLSGKGAGCWPTSEAVMADIFDCLRSDFLREKMK